MKILLTILGAAAISLAVTAGLSYAGGGVDQWGRSHFVPENPNPDGGNIPAMTAEDPGYVVTSSSGTQPVHETGPAPTVQIQPAPDDAGTMATGTATKPFRVDPTGTTVQPVDQRTYINTMACACTTATLYGDGGTLGATTAVDAGAANIPVLPYGETALYVGSNSDITIARDAPCVAYASGGSTASIPSGGWPWYVPLPNSDAGFTATYYNVCSQSGTTRVCLCPRSAVAP